MAFFSIYRIFRGLGFSCLVLFASLKLAHGDTGRSKSPPIEVCFVLDTTGSMGALIEGAKRKIWSIASRIVNDTDSSEVYFSLVGYRDLSDAYVTKVVDLTDDIDVIYAELKSFHAGGGGDMPESVNEALYDSVHKISWSSGGVSTEQDTGSVKVIFLVGDAPPHMDYQEQQYPQTMSQASEKGIVVNTIQAGSIAQATPIWKDIATLGGGIYSQIAQSGNMTNIATHYDQDLVALNIKLGQTVLPYGSSEQQEEITALQESTERMSHQLISDRASFYARKGRVAQRAGDLIDDIDAGVVRLEDVAEEALPEAVRKLAAEDRLAFIDEYRELRAVYQKTILDLATSRQEEIDRTQSDDSLDQEMVAQIRRLVSELDN